MTPDAREEIEKVVTFILITGENGGMDSQTLRAVCINKVTDLILTQVEKARAEERERCAKIALSFTVCDFDPRLAPMQDDDMQIAYRIARQIRNKLEKE